MTNSHTDKFTIADSKYSSRLLVGTGKYKNSEQTKSAIDKSGAEIVTVAIRRTNLGQKKNEPNLLDIIPPDKYTILPNTAGCYDAASAVRTCQLARELLNGHDLVKLEVLADEKTLFPDISLVLESNILIELLIKSNPFPKVFRNTPSSFSITLSINPFCLEISGNTISN